VSHSCMQSCLARALPCIQQLWGLAGSPWSCRLSNLCILPAVFLVFRPYPWGSELLAALKAASPPAIDISLQLLGALPGGRGHSCQVTLSRVAGTGAASNSLAAIQSGSLGPEGAWADRGQQAAAAADGGHKLGSLSACKLLVGCSSTDELLLLRSTVLERLESPMQVRAGFDSVLCKVKRERPLQVALLQSPTKISLSRRLCPAHWSMVLCLCF
jgi:hypothetical protein